MSATMSFRNRLLFAVILPVTLITLMLSAFYLQRVSGELDDALTARGRSVVSFLAPAAEYVLVSGDRAALEGLTARVLEQEGAVAAAVLDAEGVLIAEAGLRGRTDFAAVLGASAADMIGEINGRRGFAAPVLMAPPPVDAFWGHDDGGRLPDSVRIGWVYVEFDTSALAAERTRLLLIVGTFVFVALLLTLVLAMRLSRSVGKPVARLVDATQRMAKGDLGVRVELNAESTEMRALGEGFNAMADAIAESHRTLRSRIEEATAELAHQARHDPLTGLPNRRAFEDAIDRAVAEHRRAGDVTTLLFIDLDRFKAVNDNCGHAEGDRLLRELARLLRGRLRQQDDVFRLGGDEFAVMLRGCSREDAHALANALCGAVGDYTFQCNGQSFQVGASIGLARMEGAIQDAAAVMLAADQACYQVKRSGRGQVIEFDRPKL